MTDLNEVRERLHATWTAGDFHRLGVEQLIVGERLCEEVGIAAGQRVLDVACGAGNTTLAAARRRARATGCDWVPALLDRAEQRAKAEGLELEWVRADAEDLPFPDASFDVVLSTFGSCLPPISRGQRTSSFASAVPGGRSVWPIGHRQAPSEISSGSPPASCRRPLARGQRWNGAVAPGSANCSAIESFHFDCLITYGGRASPRSQSGWTSTAPGMARQTEPLRRSMAQRPPNTPGGWRRSSNATTARLMERSTPPTNTSTS